MRFLVALVIVLTVLLPVNPTVESIAPWNNGHCFAVESGASDQKQVSKEDLNSKDKNKDLAARESALLLREQQLNAATAELNVRLREFETMKKKVAIFQEEQKKLQSERAKKTIKIYRSLKPEETAKLLDRLDEDTASGIMNALDQKTVMQLIPYLNQARVLRWTKETLAVK